MYTVDGLTPNGAGWELIIPGTGFRGVAGRHTSSLELPSMDGSTPGMNDVFTPGVLPLRYRLLASTHADFAALLEKFNGVFGQRRKLLPVVHTYGPGVTRVNEGKVVETIVPEIFSGEVAWYQVNLTLPHPFWRSESPVTAGTPALTSSLAVYALQDFTSTAPIADALIRFKGGFSTARVIDAVTGDRIDITTPVTGSQYVVIDTANWTARLVTSDTWTGGTDFTANVETNRGRGHMFALEPDQVLTGGRYRVRVLATNPTNGPTVEVRARLSYH